MISDLNMFFENDMVSGLSSRFESQSTQYLGALSLENGPFCCRQIRLK